jgi:hypothetical protein
MTEACMVLNDQMKRCRRPAYVIIPVFTNPEHYYYPSPLSGGVLTLVCRKHLMETDEDPKKARRVRTRP